MQADAQKQELTATLAELESQYPATPAGLGITVAWGLPYFRSQVQIQDQTALLSYQALRDRSATKPKA